MRTETLDQRAVTRLREQQERLQMLRAADVEMEEIDWLWPGWLARGKFHLLAGDGGAGKTTLAIAMAAVVSRGGAWPDGSVAPRGNVLVWSGEDDIADTLVPRLAAVGADLERVFLVGDIHRGRLRRPFDPSQDLEMLISEAGAIGDASLLIVDPVVSAVVGDGHKNVDVRRSLQPLVDLGNQLRCAVLGISHFSKGGNGIDPLLRVTGSIAFGATARVVLVAGKRRDVDDRVLARAKSNIGPDDGGFCYRVSLAEGPPAASLAAWGEPVAGEARDLLADPPAGSVEGAAESVAEWLKAILGGSPVEVAVLRQEAQVAGHSWRTVERVKQSLGVRSRKDGAQGSWRWSLPSEQEHRQDRQPEGGGLGGLAPTASDARDGPAPPP